jgi:ubiquinone/menaquinone biosynthesis C-methylase UbiE
VDCCGAKDASGKGLTNDKFRPEDTRASYDKVARQYADEIAGELANKPFDREFLDRFAARVGQGRVVELGCGPGHVAGYLASRGANVAGLDLSPAMVVQAQRLFPDLTFVVGDMLALPFNDGELAGVVSFYSIVHFDEAQTVQAFAEMARVLRPGGLAAIAFHVGTDVIHRDEWFGEEVSVDFSFHEPAVVRRQLEDAGFKIDELTEREPYPPPIEFQSRRCYMVAAKPAGRRPIRSTEPARAASHR